MANFASQYICIYKKIQSKDGKFIVFDMILLFTLVKRIIKVDLIVLIEQVFVILSDCFHGLLLFRS